MVNLISNAVKFTGTRTEAKIEIGCAPGGDGETVIFIRDNGVGFDPSLAPKLFSAFERLHSQEEFEGTGIGLTIVERIIHRHGGRAWAGLGGRHDQRRRNILLFNPEARRRRWGGLGKARFFADREVAPMRGAGTGLLHAGLTLRKR